MPTASIRCRACSSSVIYRGRGYTIRKRRQVGLSGRPGLIHANPHRSKGKVFALSASAVFNGQWRSPGGRWGEHPGEERPATTPTDIMNWWTLRKLRSRIARVRRKTVKKLAAREGLGAVKFLAPMVSDPDLEVRKAVVQALSGSKDRLAVAALVNALRDADRELRWRAVKALEAAGWQPTSDEQSVWRAVAQGEFVKAAHFGAVAVERLVAELED